MHSARNKYHFRASCKGLRSTHLPRSRSPNQGKPDHPRSGQSRRGLQAKVFSLAIERAGVDAEDSRGFFTRFGVFEDEPDMLGFELLERDRSAEAHRGRRFFLCRGQFRADVAHGGPAKKRDTTACQRIRSWRSERRLIFDHLLRWLAERTPEVNLAGAAGGDGERPGRSESGPTDLSP